jgi:hypothetical protein
LVNSRLGLSSETPGKFNIRIHLSHQGPHFSLSYVCILPSSLTRVLSLALEYSSRLPVSVSVRSLIALPKRFFLGALTTRTSLHRRSTRLNRLPRHADLPACLIGSRLRPGLPSPGCALPHASSLRNYQRYGNMNPFPIDYAFQPCLRGRLTLGRRPLPRKPQASGGPESHRPFRYSYQHSHFRYLQQTSRLAFVSIRNAPLPLHLDGEARSFGTTLSLVTF